MERGRYWFVTVNHHTDDDIEKVWSQKTNWAAIGWHVGKKSEIPHVHIALRYKQAVRFSAVKKVWPLGHIEPLAGSKADVLGYLSKDGKVEERGEWKEQGHRSDLEKVFECSTFR